MRLGQWLVRANMSSSSSCVSPVASALAKVQNRVLQASSAAKQDGSRSPAPRLVAVSKTKPPELLIQAYQAGQRVFGENYIQELVEKSTDPQLLELCPDIRWHFIGTLQTNKAGKLAKVRQLSMLETITSIKLADMLNKHCAKEGLQLKVMVQVNTSGEESKSGVDPNEVVTLVLHINEKCKSLDFVGLMTIGALGHSISSTQDQSGPNPDFLRLISCRKEVAQAIERDENELELSMGMSNDFEEAIRMGSTNVRVGSSIFGARDYSKKSQDTLSSNEEKLATNAK